MVIHVWRRRYDGCMAELEPGHPDELREQLANRLAEGGAMALKNRRSAGGIRGSALLRIRLGAGSI